MPIVGTTRALLIAALAAASPAAADPPPSPPPTTAAATPSTTLPPPPAAPAPPSDAAQPPAAAQPPPAPAAPPVIGWEEAEDHVGEEVAVEGRVLGVHCSQLACLLAFEPTFNRFTAVVQARSFGIFPPATLEERYSGKRVRVQGTVEVREKKPEIMLETPGALLLLDVVPPAALEAARAGDAQAELLERMADVLERVEELTERLAGLEARMETLLAGLEERDAALAAAEAPAAPPPAPSYGEPQPRPAYETLRSIKRGMTPAEVERLIGTPEYVEASGGPRGWTTWYYGFGRSISFDARGRARSLVGFPQ